MISLCMYSNNKKMVCRWKRGGGWRERKGEREREREGERQKKEKEKEKGREKGRKKERM